MAANYLGSYGARYNRTWAEKAYPGPFSGALTGTVNLIKDGISATGDFKNYIEVDCTGLTAGNFKEKLRKFKEQILDKITRHNGITNISMDCLLKNDEKYSKISAAPRIVSVAKYNSNGNWNSGHEKMMEFSKNQQVSQDYGWRLLDSVGKFDNILDDSFTWEQLQQFLQKDDSIRMVISKKGLDDIKNTTIHHFCDDEMVGNGRHRLSRNYKKTNNRVKSSKKRSYTTKSRRTRRHRK